MRIAVIGSRGIVVENIGQYLPPCQEIISGGAQGVDTCAAAFAQANKIKLTEVLPQYERYGRAAPILRNKQIVDMADMVIAFWDGTSKGTQSVILYAQQAGKPCRVILMDSCHISPKSFS